MTAADLITDREEPATIKMARRRDWDVPYLVRAAHAKYGRSIGDQCEIEANKLIEPGDSARTIQARRGRATHKVTQEMKEILDGFD